MRRRIPRICSPSSVSSAFADDGVDQAVEALAVAVVAEVLERRLGDGGGDEMIGVEHQTKSDPPSTLMLAPVT